MTANTILFIAIDGALRPIRDGVASGDLIHVDRLVAVLAAYPDVEVVVIDPMCSTHSLDTLRQLFPVAIRDRIKDLIIPWSHHKTRESEQQIIWYLEKCEAKSQPNGVVLDWNRSRYANSAFIESTVAFVNPLTGLDRPAEIRLRTLLNRKKDTAHAHVMAAWKASFRHATGHDDDHNGYVAAPWKSDWKPKAVILCPRTLQLERVTQDGSLTRNLFRGLSRVYVHEAALIRRPQLRLTIEALQCQFPQRLVVVPFDLFHHHMHLLYISHSRRSVPDTEQWFLGMQLRDACQSDVEAGMPDPDAVLSLGLANKETFAFGWPVSLEDFDCLTEQKLKSLSHARQTYCVEREAKGIEALGNALQSADAKET